MTNKYIKYQQEGGNFVLGLPIGTYINKARNLTNTGRNWVNNKINTLGVKSGNEYVRGAAQVITAINGGLQDAVHNRTQAYINELIPGWLEEKASKHIGKGQPVWTIDKEAHVARYYDGKGNLLISSPVGTGLVSGNKTKQGDNKTPEGTYRLQAPERGKNKKGGEFDFGTYFYRTNHTNPGGSLSGIGLHGTGTPFLNGSNISHGCMRIDNSDIEKFYKIAPNRGAGTKIIISD